MGLTKLAISRPVFIFMLMLTAMLLGTISYRSMRVEQNPEVNFGVITISTVYPGAGPEEMNELVTRKIEESISGVNGLYEVVSTSQEGVSVVSAQFEIGTNMDEALNQVRSKVDSIANDLPRDVLKPTIDKFDTASSPVMNIVFSHPTMSPQELRDVLDDKIRDRFARVPGVGAVGISGGDQREIQIQVKRDKLMAYGLTVNDVLRAVQGATLNLPSGRMVSGVEEYAVRVPAEFKTVDDIRNLTIRVNDPTRFDGSGKIVRLSDIADIVDGAAEKRTDSRLNGNPAVVAVIQKSREGNAVEISEALLHKGDGVLDQIKNEFGITSTVTLNQAETIEESITDLNVALFFGIFLVCAIVYVFLHNMRGTLIVAIAIPVCLFGTFIVLKALGFTINNMSMLALSLAVAVLIDDAIVVLENIYRHLKMGEDPVSAAINGRSEIGLAAIAITMADVVVFLPIAFMGGVVGQFFKPLGIGFAVAVFLSLMVSFTVTPMLASRWYRRGEDMEHPTGRFASAFERGFKRFEDLYRRVLEWSLNHRWFVFLAGFASLVGVFVMIGGSAQSDVQGAIMAGIPIAIVCVALGALVFIVNIFRRILKPRFILFGALFGAYFIGMALFGFAFGQWKGEAIFKFQFFPVSDPNSLSVNIEMPPGTSLAETERVVKQLEPIVAAHPDVKYVLSTIGARGGGGFSAGSLGTNLASITASLNEKDALLDRIQFWKKHDEKVRTQLASAVSADLLESIGKVPGAFIKVSAGDDVGFGAPIQMAFTGNDRNLIVETVSNIRNRLAGGAVRGVINVDVTSKPGKPELQVIPDRVRAADAGVTVADVAGSLRVMYEGDDTTKFRVQGREYPIRVMMSLEDRNNPDLLSTVPVTFKQGTPIFLSEVANVQQGVGVDKIDRQNRAESVTITADLLQGFAAGTVYAQIEDYIKKENLLPEGVEIKPLGQANVQARESGYLFGALLLGFVLVYMLLASLYDNLLYPFIIQLAQPQAMVGALLALIITDKTLNIVGFVGIICLVGLVGKNAILLVDYTNTLRERGRNRHDALVEAGPVRLRPIMMTTLALILGMLPVALAIGRGSEFRETIGITIIGGITLSTLLTLVVIPCSYTIFDDISNSIGRGMRRLMRRDDDDNQAAVDALLREENLEAKPF